VGLTLICSDPDGIRGDGFHKQAAHSSNEEDSDRLERDRPPDSTEVSKFSKDLIHLLTASLRVASTVQTLLILARAVESAANWSPLMD
jgi:hypothetical protein